jgi:hypothetical protein
LYAHRTEDILTDRMSEVVRVFRVSRRTADQVS